MSSPTAVLEPAHSTRSRDASPGIAIATAVAVLLAQAPLIFAHFQQLWLKPHYQLFPIVLVGAFALAWPLAGFLPKAADGLLKTALLVMGAGMALVGVGFLVDAGMFGKLLESPTPWIAGGGVVMLAGLPLVIFASPNMVSAGRDSSKHGLIMAGLSWLMLALAVFFNSASTAGLSALVAIASLPVTLGGWPLLRRFLPAIAYLLLIVPPPFKMDAMLVEELQKLAAKVASRVLDVMGVFHVLAGVTIEIGNRKYGVEQACSGISSLLSVLACVLFYVLWYKTHWLRGTVLTLSAIFWVLVNNMARIIGIAFFDVGFTIGRRWQVDLSSGWKHQVFGIVLFGLTLALLWSTDRFLMFLGRSDLPKRRFEPTGLSVEALRANLANAIALPSAWYRSVAFVVLFGLLAVVQGAEMYALRSRVPYSGSALSSLYQQIKVDELPEKVNRWVRPEKIVDEKRDSGAALGEFSRIWRYQHGDTPGFLSLDFPYPEYHDLRVCYRNNGWTMGEKDTTAFEHNVEGQRPMKCVRVKMTRAVERYQTLWFCEFDQDGVSVDPTSLGDLEAKDITDRIYYRLEYAVGRWQRLFNPEVTASSTGLGSILQVQLLVPTNRDLTDVEVLEIQQLFLAGAEKLRTKCVELKNKPR